MRKTTSFTCVLALASLLIFSHANAGKPSDVIDISNGFPSGKHFNLNIIAKNPDTFECSLSDDGGKVIFVPENGGHFKIYMESGKKGPKSDPDILDLQVIDRCAGFSEGDNAVLRLPKNEGGYMVYARVLAKPSKGDETRGFEVFQPELQLVQDEQGNDLWTLGLVTGNSLQTPEEFIRTTGKSKAVNITRLFEFTGTVCYLAEPEGFDPLLDEFFYKCCGLIDWDLDGIYDDNSGCGDSYYDNVAYVCEYIETYCQSYATGPQWIFNIADFVDLLWGIDSNGSKLLQIRFYPIQNVTFAE
jgi:hypothetical protein